MPRNRFNPASVTGDDNRNSRKRSSKSAGAKKRQAKRVASAVTEQPPSPTFPDAEKENVFDDSPRFEPEQDVLNGFLRQVDPYESEHDASDDSLRQNSPADDEQQQESPSHTPLDDDADSDSGELADQMKELHSLYEQIEEDLGKKQKKQNKKRQAEQRDPKPEVPPHGITCREDLPILNSPKTADHVVSRVQYLVKVANEFCNQFPLPETAEIIGREELAVRQAMLSDLQKKVRKMRPRGSAYRRLPKKDILRQKVEKRQVNMINCIWLEWNPRSLRPLRRLVDHSIRSSEKDE